MSEKEKKYIQKSLDDAMVLFFTTRVFIIKFTN